jgi:hypothetical protein
MLKTSLYFFFHITLVIFILGLMALPVWGVDDEECLMCHEDPELVDDEGRSLFVVPDRYARSTHGEEEISCVGCHQDLVDIEDFPHEEELEKVECSSCHEDILQMYKESVHGVSRLQNGTKEAATCADCHSKHEVFRADDPHSWTNPLNLPKTCGSCHEDERIVSRFELGDVEMVKTYLKSIHGRALKEAGLTVVAVCNDCHGTHDIRRVNDPKSRVWKTNVPKTCSKCHGGIFIKYAESIHGKDLAAGNLDVPVCTDCHGEHTIQKHEDPQSKIFPANIPGTCSKCHDDEKLTTRFGLPSKRLATYGGSYHGTALRLGDLTVANCASCHGAHEILPPSDPRSSIHPDRLHLTCGKCHPRAGANFAKGKIHVDDTKESNPGVFVARQFYKVMITGLVSAFVGLIFLDLLAKKRRRRKE